MNVNQAEATTNITKVGVVGIPVADQDRALEFYVGKLGFEKRLDVLFGDGGRWVEVAPPGAVTALALVGPVSGQDPGIRCATSDVEADHARLRARGVDTDPEVTHAGAPVPPMFGVRDPDGNRLLIVQGPAGEHSQGWLRSVRDFARKEWPLGGNPADVRCRGDLQVGGWPMTSLSGTGTC